MAVITPSDRPKSVRNNCVIEVFGGVFVLSRCFLDFFCGFMFCHMTESDLFLFLSEARDYQSFLHLLCEYKLTALSLHQAKPNLQLRFFNTRKCTTHKLFYVKNIYKRFLFILIFCSQITNFNQHLALQH